MSSVNWYIIILTIVTMTIVGFYSFNNTVSALIFGAGAGGIFGWSISSIIFKKPSEDD